MVQRSIQNAAQVARVAARHHSEGGRMDGNAFACQSRFEDLEWYCSLEFCVSFAVEPSGQPLPQSSGFAFSVSNYL